MQDVPQAVDEHLAGPAKGDRSCPTSGATIDDPIHFGRSAVTALSRIVIALLVIALAGSGSLALALPDDTLPDRSLAP